MPREMYHTRDRGHSAEPERKRTEPHMLDRRVCEQALVILLDKDEKCRDADRDQAENDEKRACPCRITEREINYRLEAQDGEECDGQEHARKQGRYGGRRGTMRIGKPRM